MLFAFDGTGNTDDLDWLRQQGSSLSNVVRFRNAYARMLNGEAHYVTGVGTVHRDLKYGDITVPALDAGTNRTGVDRISRMMLYLRDEADTELDDNKAMEIDIVGFSRGAAQARDFSNQITNSERLATVNGKTYYKYKNIEGKDACQAVNFRFMGLWDTVLSTNSGRGYNMDIPSQFANVAQAVALNEYRSQPAPTWDLLENRNFYSRTRTHLPDSRHWGGFPLESIGNSNNTPGAVRIERGFIGAHADIGGGYAEGENQLSLVPLNWMLAQAEIAGVKIKSSEVLAVSTDTAVLHDQSNLIRFGDPTKAPATFEVNGFTEGLLGAVTYNTEDRKVNGAVSGSTQRTMGFGLAEAGGNRSMTNVDTNRYITYQPRPDGIAQDRKTSEDIEQIKALKNQTGTVDMQKYISWLREHGYVFAGGGGILFLPGANAQTRKRRRMLMRILAVMLSGCKAPMSGSSQPEEEASEDVAQRRRFQGISGGELVVDSLTPMGPVGIFQPNGLLFRSTSGHFAPNGRSRSSYGSSAAGDRLVVPQSLRMIHYGDDARVLFNPLPFKSHEGTVISDVTVQVASRIPDQVLNAVRRDGGGLRLKLRLTPETILVGWDIERRPGFDPKRSLEGQYYPPAYSHTGGDFKEARLAHYIESRSNCRECVAAALAYRRNPSVVYTDEPNGFTTLPMGPEFGGNLPKPLADHGYYLTPQINAMSPRRLREKGWYIHPKTGQRIETDF